MKHILLNHSRSKQYNYIQYEFNYKDRDFSIYTTDFNQNDECDAIIMMEYGHGFVRMETKVSKLFTEQGIDHWLTELADIIIEDYESNRIRQ